MKERQIFNSDSGFWCSRVIHLHSTKFYTEDEDSMLLQNTSEASGMITKNTTIQIC